MTSGMRPKGRAGGRPSPLIQAFSEGQAGNERGGGPDADGKDELWVDLADGVYERCEWHGNHLLIM